ncbi:hypothetical protein AGMMS49975_22050 [Clostridia bacterium]|nr:hypothetical protein AGMMS49975_22050 [Clostridia bacterium]
MESIISGVFDNALTVGFDSSSKIVIMSDCHRGDGSFADDFIHNQNIMHTALSYYYNNGYTYIELGDGDELWENSSFELISAVNANIFNIMSKFYQKKRLYLIYGNHDMVKKYPEWVENNFTNGLSELHEKEQALFPKIQIHEGIILNNAESGHKIFLLHGHQADFFNYKLWRLAMFLVRYVWHPLQLLAFHDPSSPSPKINPRLEKWAEEHNCLVIAGHTHHVFFPPPKTSMYFNDGCCVYPYFISAIEIEGGNVSLIKWSTKSRADGVLYVGRDIFQTERIEDYYKII